MSINIFSTVPMWGPPYNIQTQENVIVTEFDQGNDQSNRLQRFPKRSVELNYRSLSRANRDTLYAFWKGQGGPFRPFWFFDVVSRNWVDEYVGYQGPLSVDSAFRFDFSASSYTDYTMQANSTTSTDFPLMPASSISLSTGDGFFLGADFQWDKATFTIGVNGVGTYTFSPKYYSAPVIGLLVSSAGWSMMHL